MSEQAGWRVQNRYSTEVPQLAGTQVASQGTLEDGDLPRWTRVDVLPLDGMQEVWGSNPHSSTGKRRNSKTRTQGSGQVQQQGTAAGGPHISSDPTSASKRPSGPSAPAGTRDETRSGLTRKNVPPFPLMTLGVLSACDLAGRGRAPFRADSCRPCNRQDR